MTPRPAPIPPAFRPAAAASPTSAEQADAWSRAREQLAGLPGGAGLNIGHEAPRSACRRAARQCHGPAVAGPPDEVREVSYRELAADTARFANALGELGVDPGERVFTLLGRVPELYVAVLGSLKARCVVSPLFAAFGPEPVAQRMRLGEAAVLVTTPALYRRTVAPVRNRLPALRHVLLTGGPTPGPEPGTTDLATLLEHASSQYVIGPTEPDSPALLHFTSGATGTPKGALHVQEAVVAHAATARAALDLHVDPRVLRPLDEATVLESVRRTHRLVVVDNAWRSGSLAGEVAARVAEQAFYDLDAPIERVCGAEVPIPYPRHLEEAALPGTAGIAAAARRAVG